MKNAFKKEGGSKGIGILIRLDIPFWTNADKVNEAFSSLRR